MDGQRLEAYEDLIDRLLQSPDGEESNILQANAGLRDQKFQEALLERSKLLIKCGKLDDANRLMNLSAQYKEIPRKKTLEHLGQKYYTEQQYEEAIPLFREWLEISQAEVDRYSEMLAAGWLGSSYARLKQYEEAIGLHRIWLDIAREQNNVEQGYIALSALAEDAWGLQDYKKAADFYAQKLVIAESRNQKMEIANTCFYLAQVSYAAVWIPESIAYYERAIALYTELDNREWLNQSLVNLSQVYEGLKEYDKAIVLQQSRLVAARETGDLGNIQEICYELGSLNDDAKHYEEAIQFLKQSLELSIELERKYSEANSSFLLGQVYRYMERFVDAIPYYEKAIDLYSIENDQKWMGTSLDNLGKTYRALKDYDNAIAQQQKQLALAQEIGDQVNMQDAYYDIGCLNNDEERYEEAILFFKQSLELSLKLKRKWSEANSNFMLGQVYFYAKRFVDAIPYYQRAIDLYSSENNQEWLGQSLSYLGKAYRYLGEYERSISAYRLALDVYKHIGLPQEISMIQNSIVEVQIDRAIIDGLTYNQNDSSQSIEAVITMYKYSLEVYKREEFPHDWATLQMNLGTAYLKRIYGDHADNIELAIAAYKLALEEYTREKFPYDWARTNMNLGSAYGERIQGKRAKNIELAVAAYKLALEEYTREKFPYNWAKINMNLGVICVMSDQGDRGENIELAIAAYKLALEEYKCEEFPYDWAMANVNLGNAYSQSIRGDLSENIELAIAAYKLALEEYTREKFPYDWATTNMNLGNAYVNRIQGDRIENIEIAITAYKLALEKRNREDLPFDYITTQFNLGLAYIELNCLEDAKQAFSSAIETIDLIRVDIISGDETKRKFNERWHTLYLSIVKVCIQLQDYQSAITYADRSKARNLVELTITKNLYSQSTIPIEIQQRIKSLSQQINQEGLRVEQISYIERDTTHINHLRQEFQSIFPYQPLTYPEIQLLSNPQTTILEWYITNDKFMLFILVGEEKSTLAFWQSSSKDQANLIDWTNKYLIIYRLIKFVSNEKSRIQAQIVWQEFLSNQLIELTKILHLDEIIKQYVPADCEQLILIPHKFLHLFPLHALPLNDGSYLIDRFPQGIRYAPSCQILQRIQQRQQPTTDRNQRLLAIRNPTEDLDYTNLEVDAISKLFQPSDILKGKAATKDALHQQSPETAQYAHFSCHGYFNFENPLQSALLLAGCKISPLPPEPDPSRYLPTSATSGIDLHKCLTLEDIFRLDLRQCRLVVLSACETGITDFTSTSDEYIGLPSAFLYAGASNVVSSLWSVSDLSTAFLMIRFYEYFQGNTETKDAKNNAAMSLKLAQQWLRDSTKADLQAWSIQNESYFNRNQNMHIAALFDHSYKDVSDNHKIFVSPFYWAAFQAIGK